MKTPRIINAMENIDADLITEAVDYLPKKKSISAWTKWGAAAACFCICVISIFCFWHPGFGKMTEVHHIVVSQENVYYSVWNQGAFLWNPSMKSPEKLQNEGRFFKTDTGLILYSASEDMLWNVNDNELSQIGKAGIQNILDNPSLIGITDGYAYWVGERLDLPEDDLGMAIVRTSLSCGEAETIVNQTNGSIASCTIHGDNLYYQIFEEEDAAIEKLYARNLITSKETLIHQMPVGIDGLSGRVYYTEKYILIVGGNKDDIYKMSYDGGEAKLLTEVVPITSAMDEWNGQIYFETTFGENESDEFLSGNGSYSEELVSVDLETGALTRMSGFNLGNEDGTVRFTVTELAMSNHGFYFTDPQLGLFYHSFEDGKDIPIC